MHQSDEVTDRIMSLVADYVVDRLGLDPVPLDHPESMTSLAQRAPNLIGERPRPPEEVFAQFTDVLATSVISVDSPRYLSFIPAAPTKASLMFDMVVSASSLNATSWLDASGAVHAENQALAVLAAEMGMPVSAGGCFVSGGSAGNLSALAVARDAARRRLGDPRAATSIVCSDQAHSSVSNTAHLLDVDVITVPTVDGRLTGRGLAAVAGRLEQPERVMAVVATAGTTNLGIVDELDAIADVATAHGWWFHVDGAYGAAARLAPSARSRFDGIEGCDSMVVDPHKWLFAPFDCAALLYREPAVAAVTHAQHAGYLDVLHDTGDPSDVGWNPADYAHHLTRRARGLALWFSLAVHGLGAYRDAIEAALSLARWTADRVREAPHLDLVIEPQLSVVAFTRSGWNAGDYQRFSDQLLADQVGFVVPSNHDGKPILRCAFLHPGTTTGMVAEVLDRL